MNSETITLDPRYDKTDKIKDVEVVINRNEGRVLFPKKDVYKLFDVNIKDVTVSARDHDIGIEVPDQILEYYTYERLDELFNGLVSKKYGDDINALMVKHKIKWGVKKETKEKTTVYPNEQSEVANLKREIADLKNVVDNLVARLNQVNFYAVPCPNVTPPTPYPTTSPYPEWWRTPITC